MRNKVYFVIVLILLLVGLGLGLYVWYLIQKPALFPSSPEVISEEEIPSEQPSQGGGTETEPVTIEVKTLTNKQQELLRAFGIKSETVTITEDMMRCAREAIGEKRLQEITNGAAPTPLEAVRLVPCFKR